MRVLARHDHERGAAIMRWPVREALLAYVAVERDRAVTQFRHEQVLYALAAPWASKAHPIHPPKVPAILRSIDGNA